MRAKQVQSLAFATWEYEELEKRRRNWKKKIFVWTFLCLEVKLKICHYHKYLKTAWRWTSGTQCPQRLWRRRLHESKYRTQADFMVTILTDEWQMPIPDSDQTHRQTERHNDRLTMTDNDQTHRLTNNDRQHYTATNTSSHFCNDASHRQRWADSTLQEQQNVCIKAQK